MSQPRQLHSVRTVLCRCVITLLAVLVSSLGNQHFPGAVVAFSADFLKLGNLRACKARYSVGARMSESSAFNGGREDPSPGFLECSETLAEKETATNLMEQAKMLRDDAERLREQLEKKKADQLAKRTAKVDSWIEKLLIESQVDDRTQLLKSEQQVLLRLQEDRFSQEQINAIFNRICELGPQSRSKCSPLMELLVDSVGKMDELERQENPNKRWSGKVERVLRRRLFAMDWNMDIEENEDDDMNPWRLR